MDGTSEEKKTHRVNGKMKQKGEHEKKNGINKTDKNLISKFHPLCAVFNRNLFLLVAFHS